MALELRVENWRWAGVPFFLRTGKRLARTITEIAVHFKRTPHSIFRQRDESVEPNVIVIRFKPDEGISVTFSAKVPGEGMRTSRVRMDFDYEEAFGVELPDAYETLLLDAMQGDPMLFTRARRGRGPVGGGRADPGCLGVRRRAGVPELRGGELRARGGPRGSWRGADTCGASWPDPRGVVAVHADIASLAADAAGRFVAAAEACRPPPVRVVLTGGSTAPAIYELLAGDLFASRIDWRRVHVWWTDERCVPPDDPRSNYGAARR